MAVNMNPSPAVWPGEEQPSLMDHDDPVSSQAAVIPMPCGSPGGEELLSSCSSLADSRPPRSKSKGELVIVINEKLKNGEFTAKTQNLNKNFCLVSNANISAHLK